MNHSSILNGVFEVKRFNICVSNSSLTNLQLKKSELNKRSNRSWNNTTFNDKIASLISQALLSKDHSQYIQSFHQSPSSIGNELFKQNDDDETFSCRSDSIVESKSFNQNPINLSCSSPTRSICIPSPTNTESQSSERLRTEYSPDFGGKSPDLNCQNNDELSSSSSPEVINETYEDFFRADSISFLPTRKRAQQTNSRFSCRSTSLPNIDVESSLQNYSRNYKSSVDDPLGSLGLEEPNPLLSDSCELMEINLTAISVAKYFKLSGVDESSSNIQPKFSVTIYFPAQFYALRSRVVANGNQMFIDSISHCTSFSARGGKSGSNFSRTSDNRFLLKHVGKPEVKMFCSIALQYFEYMSKTFEAESSSLLVKILGVYCVKWQNLSLANESNGRRYFFVMPNLFCYEKLDQCKFIFDLKGTERSRLADSLPHSRDGVHSEEQILLLDSDLDNLLKGRAIRLTRNSYRILMRAIYDDTGFLSHLGTFDYSLLIGCTESKYLICGIIDWCAIWTWARKVESLAKLIANTELRPTAIEPRQYRQRFLKKMEKYFAISRSASDTIA